MISRTNLFAAIYENCKSRANIDMLAEPRPFPLLVDVELTNLCNFQCITCPTGRRVLSRPLGFMTSEIFEKILKEAIKELCLGIRFVRWGEPTLHPCLLKFIGQAVEAGIKCHINTNGFFCDDEFIERIVRIPLHSIKFSLQGLDKSTYEIVRRNGDFLKLMDAIQTLYEYRFKRKFPFMTIDTTITDESPERIDNFKKVMGGICDKVSVGKTREIIFPKSPQTNFPQCPEVFNKLSIDWDGVVTACCGDWNRLMVVGDVRKQTLKEIWNSERLNYFRKTIVARRHNTLPLCGNCKL